MFLSKLQKMHAKYSNVGATYSDQYNIYMNMNAQAFSSSSPKNMCVCVCVLDYKFSRIQ